MVDVVIVAITGSDFLRMNIENDNERDCSTYVCAHAGEHTHGHTCRAWKLMVALVLAKFCFLLVRHKRRWDL